MSLSFSSSAVRARFSDTSNSLMFFPTIFSSSSSSFTVASASSALSTARSRFTSVIASLREHSSYFLSESSAIVRDSLLSSQVYASTHRISCRSLRRSFELHFCHRKFTRALIVFLVGVFGDHLSFSECQLQFCYFVFIVHVQVVQHFALSLCIVGCLC